MAPAWPTWMTGRLLAADFSAARLRYAYDPTSLLILYQKQFPLRSMCCLYCCDERGALWKIAWDHFCFHAALRSSLHSIPGSHHTT